VGSVAHLVSIHFRHCVVAAPRFFLLRHISWLTFLLASGFVFFCFFLFVLFAPLDSFSSPSSRQPRARGSSTLRGDSFTMNRGRGGARDGAGRKSALFVAGHAAGQTRLPFGRRSEAPKEAPTTPLPAPPPVENADTGHDTARSRGAACSEDAPRRTVAGPSLAPTTTNKTAEAGCLPPPPVSNSQPLSDPLHCIGATDKSASDGLGARAASSSTRVKMPGLLGGRKLTSTSSKQTQTSLPSRQSSAAGARDQSALASPAPKDPTPSRGVPSREGHDHLNGQRGHSSSSPAVTDGADVHSRRSPMEAGGAGGHSYSSPLATSVPAAGRLGDYSGVNVPTSEQLSSFLNDPILVRLLDDDSLKVFECEDPVFGLAVPAGKCDEPEDGASGDCSDGVDGAGAGNEGAPSGGAGGRPQGPFGLLRLYLDTVKDGIVKGKDAVRVLKALQSFIVYPPDPICRDRLVHPEDFYMTRLLWYVPFDISETYTAYCPHCKSTNVRVNGWSGYRRVIDVTGCFFAITRRYMCMEEHVVGKQPQTFMAWHEDLLAAAPADISLAFPVILTHRLGISSDLFGLLRALFFYDVGPAQFAKIVREMHTREHHKRHRAYLTRLDRYIQSDSVKQVRLGANSKLRLDLIPTFSAFDSPLGYSGNCSSEHLFRDVYVKNMQILAGPMKAVNELVQSTIMSGDQFFKIVKTNLTVKGRPLFMAAYSLVNELTQVVAIVMTQTKTLEELRDMLEGIQRRHVGLGLPRNHLRVFYTDNPLAEVDFLESIFPSLVAHDEQGSAMPGSSAPRSVYPLLTIPSSHKFVYARTTDEANYALEIQYKVLKSKSSIGVVGLDGEWDINAPPSHLDVVQVSTEDYTIVVHLSLMEVAPVEMCPMLEDPKVIKTGKNVSGDLARLKKCCGFEYKSKLELSAFAKSKLLVPSGRVSLLALCEALLGKSLDKRPSVRLSDWSRPLSHVQQSYAGLDSYASLLVYKAIDAAPSPTPSMAAFVNGSHSGVAVNVVDGSGSNRVATGTVHAHQPARYHDVAVQSKDRVLVEVTKVLVPSYKLSFVPAGWSRRLGSASADANAKGVTPLIIVSRTNLRLAAHAIEVGGATGLPVRPNAVMAIELGDELYDPLANTAAAASDGHDGGSDAAGGGGSKVLGSGRPVVEATRIEAATTTPTAAAAAEARPATASFDGCLEEDQLSDLLLSDLEGSSGSLDQDVINSVLADGRPPVHGDSGNAGLGVYVAQSPAAPPATMSPSSPTQSRRSSRAVGDGGGSARAGMGVSGPRGLRSGVRGDVWHAMDRMIRVIPKGHGATGMFAKSLSFSMLMYNAKDAQAARRVAARKFPLQSWAQMLYYEAKWINKRVRRLVPAPDLLRRRIAAVINKYANVIDAKTKQPLFNAAAWAAAKGVLKLAEEGWLSDPVDVPLYILAKRDSDGLPLWLCSRGTNSNEGSVHQKLHKHLMSLKGASPELLQCELLDWLHRTNLEADARHVPGTVTLGHPDTWLMDDICLLEESLLGKRVSCPTWRSTAEYDAAEQTRDFPCGVITMPERQIVASGLPDAAACAGVAVVLSTVTPMKRWLAMTMGTRVPVLPVHLTAEKVLFADVRASLFERLKRTATDGETAVEFNKRAMLVWKEVANAVRRAKEAKATLPEGPGIYFKAISHIVSYNDFYKNSRNVTQTMMAIAPPGVKKAAILEDFVGYQKWGPKADEMTTVRQGPHSRRQAADARAAAARHPPRLVPLGKRRRVHADGGDSAPADGIDLVAAAVPIQRRSNGAPGSSGEPFLASSQTPPAASGLFRAPPRLAPAPAVLHVGAPPVGELPAGLGVVAAPPVGPLPANLGVVAALPVGMGVVATAQRPQGTASQVVGKKRRKRCALCGSKQCPGSGNRKLCKGVPTGAGPST